MSHTRRFYRSYSGTRGFNFNVKADTTDLFITSDRDLSADAYRILAARRQEIEEHISSCREFLYSLSPLEACYGSPPIVLDMYRASAAAGVGPMAAVAGAVAEYVGRGLLELTDEVIVENGGDIWLKLKTSAILGIYVNSIYFRDRIRLKINPENTPCAVCTSSASLGHSLSFGKADAATIVAESGALSDAVATGACNLVQSEDDLQRAVDYAMSVNGVSGCLIIYRDKFAACGEIELC
ncbi:MAG TPA: UPF0280 family protein [Spirochaetota bacterium]|nr:UPF0280 family protein [Spirochaetota bacterium]HPR38231.1 UPF0280 family protein [Spirochaetota bacterium]